MNGTSSQIERTAAAWLARRDRTDWSADDQAAFAAWLAADTAHRVAYLRLAAVWRDAARLKVMGAGVVPGPVPERGAWRNSPWFATASDTGWQPRSRRGRSRAERSGRNLRLAGIAAAMLVAAALVVAIAWRDAGRPERGAWQTAIGQRQEVQLPDGSTATLAGDSELRVSMDRRVRNLDLVRGEAFFDVAKDHARPFIVHARGYRVVAVGTRFDVSRDNDGLRVVVTRGVVRLQPADANGLPATDLPAGSIALVGRDGVVVRRVAPVQAAEYLGWRDGYVAFHDTPLARAVDEFNRYNPRRIVIADPALGTLRVGGHFRLDNSEAFVRLLQQMFPIDAEQRDDLIVLSRRHARANMR